MTNVKRLFGSLALGKCERVYSGAKLHKCREGENFSSRSSHPTATHTGEKLYVTASSVAKHLALTKHDIFYSTIKTYECIKCGKSYRYKTHPIRHQKIPIREKSCECNKCVESFRAVI